MQTTNVYPAREFFRMILLENHLEKSVPADVLINSIKRLYNSPSDDVSSDSFPKDLPQIIKSHGDQQGHLGEEAFCKLMVGSRGNRSLSQN